jgi:membrane-bound serine protease (ClpP class)
MMLIDPSSPLETAIDISMNVIITTVVIITLLFVLLALLVIKAHKRKAMTGESGMIGAEAEVIKDILNGKGSVKLMGEIWDAVSDDNIVKGEKVVVTSVNNLTLTVKKSK